MEMNFVTERSESVCKGFVKVKSKVKIWVKKGGKWLSFFVCFYLMEVFTENCISIKIRYSSFACIWMKTTEHEVYLGTKRLLESTCRCSKHVQETPFTL